jgi:hypothetical protein
VPSKSYAYWRLLVKSRKMHLLNKAAQSSLFFINRVGSFKLRALSAVSSVHNAHTICALASTVYNCHLAQAQRMEYLFPSKIVCVSSAWLLQLCDYTPRQPKECFIPSKSTFLSSFCGTRFGFCVHTSWAFSTITNPHQEPAPGQPATLLILIKFLSLFFGAGVSQYLVPKWLLFLIYCGERFFTACTLLYLFPFL